MLHPSKIVGMVLSMTMTVVLVLTALSMAADVAYQPGQIIAKFSPTVGKVMASNQEGQVSVGISSLDQRLERYGARDIGQVFPHKHSELSLIYQIDFDPQYDARAVAHDFAGDINLLYAEPRYHHRPCDTPNDPNYMNGLQWFFNTVDAPEAWDVTHGDPSVIIGIVDTGVDWNHPDLMDNRWLNSGEDIDSNLVITSIDWNGIDDDGNGYIDDFYGWDFGGAGYPDNFPDEAAPLHGTHTAGICAAMTDNELTNAGMSWNCTYMPVKVSRDGSSNITYGYEGIQYAADNGAVVINISWAREGAPSAFEQEIIDSAFAKGAILVAAAGNDQPGTAYAPPDTCPLSYPAVYSHVTAVAATDMADRAADFTYYGTWVDVSAPGKAIYSAQWNDSYVMQAGNTSSACALVSGVAALLKVTEPDMNGDQFEARMLTTSDYIDNLNPTYVGWLGGGRLNAYRALMNIVSVEEAWTTGATVPQDYMLSQNHPNPFNPSTTISYSLPLAGEVTLRVYNVKGELVKTLVEGTQPAGQYAVQWNGRNGEGREVASGIYFCCLEAGHLTQTKKMVLLK
jgi:serine protease